MQYFFDTKTNFFQLRKIFTREYIKNASGNHSKSAFFACFILQTTQTNNKERKRIISIIKNKGCGLWESVLFLKIKGGAF